MVGNNQNSMLNRSTLLPSRTKLPSKGITAHVYIYIYILHLLETVTVYGASSCTSEPWSNSLHTAWQPLNNDTIYDMTSLWSPKNHFDHGSSESTAEIGLRVWLVCVDGRLRHLHHLTFSHMLPKSSCTNMVPRVCRYPIAKNLGLKDHIYSGFSGLVP